MTEKVYLLHGNGKVFKFVDIGTTFSEPGQCAVVQWHTRKAVMRFHRERGTYRGKPKFRRIPLKEWT